MSTELVAHGAALPLTEVAYSKFTQARIDLLMKAKGNGAPLEIFYAFLELSARYDLDPLADEIWLAPMSGRNGQGGRLSILIGRNGYLKVARGHEDFIDVDADVVYSEDEYRVTRKADGTRTVEHSYGNPAKRGEAVGAYAVLQRNGYPDKYFFAPLAQYAKDASKSAWSYRDSMIIKCAVSYITRITYGVSGAVPADEVGAGLALDRADGNVIDAEGHETQPLALPQDLATLVARAAAVDSKSWRANEVAARLPDQDDRAYESAVRQIVSELQAWLVENEPQDAVVVFPDRNGDGSVDVAAELQHRWDVDPGWRGKVQPLLSRYVDAETGLEAAIGDGEDEKAAEMREALGDVAAELRDLGVPEGWWPETAGDQS